MRRAKSTLQNCDLVTAGGFQERTAADSPLDQMSVVSDQLTMKQTPEQSFMPGHWQKKGFGELLPIQEIPMSLCKPAFSRAMVLDWKGKATDLCCCTQHKHWPSSLKNFQRFTHLLDATPSVCCVGLEKQRPGRYSNNTTHCWMALDMRLSVMNNWQMQNSTFVGYTRAMKLTRRSTMFGSNSSTKVQKTMKLPPTQSSLQQHIKQAHRQCVVWHSSVVAQPDIPSTVGNSWYKDPSTGQTLSTSADWRAISWRVPSTNTMPV